MKEELISLETGKLAKEKGLNFVTSHFINKWCDSATVNLNSLKNKDQRKDFVGICSQSVLQRWLREAHNLTIPILRQPDHWGYFVSRIEPYKNLVDSSAHFNNYEECLEDALQTALKLIK